MTAERRDWILGSLRDALRRTQLPDASSDHPGPFPFARPAPSPGDAALVLRFGEELEALHGAMHHVASEADACAIVLDIVKRNGADRVLTWDPRWIACPGLVAALESAGIEVVNPGRHTGESDRREVVDAIEPIAVGLTGALAGLADTGSLVLAAGSGRSRMASLLPPVHIAVLPQARLYATLPAFLAANRGAAGETSNLVLVTGPSRTADIEMTLTHGVHGPREVHVIVVADRVTAP
jgi:L-lactate dehydrogenase complex protein LldG